ncbi:MAG: DUF2330 domain-containing protein [Alphaproteobacteria bacterium]|nr:DUF2330 domain-containing protein [Alphaproteobacteria bacterium]MCB9793008.1 DUF2330 domain-containing protein [Alphaproteobacteria bacterium]
MLLLSFSLAAGSASAFCGNYVGQAGAELVNGASEVALVRQGDRTTITMANDFAANVGEFAVVVPVPEILGEDDVRVLDPGVFATLDVYSGPRLVSYTCEELYPEVVRSGLSIGCAQEYSIQTKDAAWDEGSSPSDVDVEANFIVGEYEIVVLSAEQSSSLLIWLEDNGYAVPQASQSLFQEYIDAGSYFFAAKVNLALQPEASNWLSPLQFSYSSEVFSLPIRPGAVNSPGSQDLVIYAITEPEAGQVRVSNYPEVSAEDECLFEGAAEAFGEFYEGQFDAAVTDTASWVVEYGWSVSPWVSSCDPCPPTETAEPMPTEKLLALGYDPTPDVDTDTGFGQGLSYYFTRLRMRYTPEQAQEDLLLYASGDSTNTQQRYVQHADYLEDLFPICGVGWTEDPGSCKDESAEMRRRVREANRQEGCAAESQRAWPLGLLLMAMMGVALRRRRRC